MDFLSSLGLAEYLNFSNFLAVASIVAAVVIYLREKKVSSIQYTKHDLIVVNQNGEGLGDDLKISYKGVDVPRVTQTAVVLWNAGNHAIRPADIATSDPLRIEVAKDTQVLQYRISRSSSQNCKFKIAENEKNVIFVDFEYIEPGHGVLIELLHDGSSDPFLFDNSEVVDIKGKVIGGADEPEPGVALSILASISHSRTIKAKLAKSFIAVGLPLYIGYAGGLIANALYRVSLSAYAYFLNLPDPVYTTAFFGIGPVVTVSIAASYVICSIGAWRSFKRAQPSTRSWAQDVAEEASSASGSSSLKVGIAI